MLEIKDTVGQPTGHSAPFDRVLNGGFLTKGKLLGNGVPIPVRIIRARLVQISKIVKFVPVRHPVPITVLRAGNIMGNNIGGSIDIQRYLVCRHAGNRRLPLTVYRPVGKIVPIGRPVQTAGGYRAVALDIVVRLRDKPSRVALDSGKHHGSIGINKPVGQPAGHSAPFDRVLNGGFLTKGKLLGNGVSIPVRIIRARLV